MKELYEVEAQHAVTGTIIFPIEHKRPLSKVFLKSTDV